MTETHRRYELLAKQKLTNVGQLNESALIPRVVVVIDEFANLLEGKESKKLLNSLLKQIGSMARAAGIHLVLATQRPDKDVVTPLLRDNLPGRIALQVPKPAGSELILNSPNAAYLLGKGDLLWQRGGGVLRLQSPFVSQPELERALRVE
jgi:S-DNA-T family DNA segregation ATPase FtsK/SpoIIIE